MSELLAPVGGRLQLEAAINNGADAVYMGGPLFNARIKADNFTNKDLQEAIDFAHERNVKVYITFNTLIKDSELGKAFEYACFLYEAGADAIIIQDLGLANLIHLYLPNFPMHLSTQGTVYNTHALELVKQLGFKRVVPARELSLDEIRRICSVAHGVDAMSSATGTSFARKSSTGTSSARKACTRRLEVEVFVHGALCMCYSGQCQMSRLLGAKSGNSLGREKDGLGDRFSGRSGNRGLCAQPCRLPYTDDKGRTGYWLSPKDICTLEMLPQLISAGVDSFKIEGRLKSPEYVATVTRIYRKYMDIYMESAGKKKAQTNIANLSIAPEDMQELTQIFNRGGFSHGYLDGNPGREILSGDSPKNQGVYIGKVYGSPMGVRSKSRVNEKTLIDVNIANHKGDKASSTGSKNGRIGNQPESSASETIHIGDGVEIRAGQFVAGNVVTYLKMLGGSKIRIGDFDKGIHEGDKVYKVTDKELNAKALQAASKKLPVSMRFKAEIGDNPVLEIFEKNTTKSKERQPLDYVKVRGDFITEKAQHKSIDSSRVTEQISKLGDTPFEAEDVQISIAEGIMVPVSIMNKMRREATEKLLAIKHVRRTLPEGIRTGKDLASLTQDNVNEQLDENELLARKKLRVKNELLTDNKLLIENRQLLPLKEFMALRDEKRVKTVPYILNVSRGELDKFIETNFDEIACAVKSTGIIIGNLGWIKQFLGAGITVYGDYGLNAYNNQCVKAFEKLGIKMIHLSYEAVDDSTCGNIRDDSRFGGRIPLMITEHPLETDYLIDRKGVKHDIIHADDKHLIF